ncbi:MAG: HIT family protein [Candidatus Abawacabacteria bacterium]|nr:HIT family protein [Candidatus Abawacabacteria bacterium]
MSWKDKEKWAKMKSGEACPLCADIHLDENPFSFKIIELEHTFIRLPRNQFCKGWIFVALKKHATELFELSTEELNGFWKEVTIAATAVNQIFKPVKINYAIFGNLCPHLHCHVSPRRFEDDPHAPIQTKNEVLLSDAEYQKLIQDFQSAIEAIK